VSEKLRFGLIGLGEIAYKSTGRLLQHTEKSVAVAGMDPVPQIAASFEEEFGIPCSTSLDDLLGNPDLDAVIVSTPHDLHVPLGIKAAEAGKHVIVEKPMATTLADADALISACRSAGVLCSSKEGGTRYQPATEKTRELIASGAIGDVMATQVFGASNKPASYWTGGYTGRVQTTWRRHKSESGGGVFLMNYIYDVYRIRYVTGLEVTRVFAEYDTFKTPVEVEDFITVSLRFDNGAVGTFFAGSCASGGRRSGIRGTQATGNRIFGTEGQIVFRDGDLVVYSEGGADDVPAGEWTELTFDPELTRNSFGVYFDRFAEAVFEGRTPDVPGEEGRRNLEVLLAAYRSGKTHEPVALPMVE